jgi:superfamily II DNA or RNA helicase
MNSMSQKSPRSINSQPTFEALPRELWQNQQDAVRMCDRYFRSHSTGAALVQMPTGSGKTGVIAVVASVRAIQKPVLVISPSAALTEQLRTDVGSKFWDDLGIGTAWRPQRTFQVLPSAAAEMSKELGAEQAGRLILFTTIQALLQLEADHAEAYEWLRQSIGTAIFDEGHREPAPLWARTVRKLRVPTILSTATPFRNDLKMFNVDTNHVQYLSFHDAVTRRLIRDVKIETVAAMGAREFAQEIVERRDRLIRSGSMPSTTKVIIRCASESSVREMHNALRRILAGRSEGILAMHDQFRKNHATLLGAVPHDLRKRNERFLVHQFILTEGVDDPSCSILAIYEPFSTARQLIQQIGRVIRHPQPCVSAAPPAQVIAIEGDGAQKNWDGYQAFDLECAKAGGRPPLRTGAGVARELAKSLPEIDYSFGQFRRKVPLDSEEIDEHLRVPQSCIVFLASREFDLKEFFDDVQFALDEMDRDVLRTDLDDSGGFHLSLGLKQSDLLEEALFQEPSLQLTVYVKQGEFLFFYDSGGLWIDEVCDSITRLPAAHLRSFIPNEQDTAITMLAVKNSDIGPFSIRSRQLSAPAVAISVPFMGEHMNVVTRVSGRVGKMRRYVGFERSRIRDGERVRGDVNEFRSWTETIAQELREQLPGAALFDRFALPIAPPAQTAAINILLDADEIASEFVPADDSISLDIDDVCIDVNLASTDPKRGRSFLVKMNHSSFEAWIDWDPKRQKYLLTSDDLEVFRLKDRPKVTLTKWLNQRQMFRVIPEEKGVIFASGRFYAIDLRLGPSFGAGALLLDLLTPVSELADLKTEKGKPKGKPKSWPKGSVFELFDSSCGPGQGAARFGQRFGHIVCDDLNDETADFICMNDDYLVLAHLKSGTGSLLAASQLYDVCSQAVKNLAFLKADNRALPGDGRKWNRPWKYDGALIKRVRQGRETGAQLRDRFMSLRRRPATRRQTWLVLGALLSKRIVHRELERGTPSAQLIQAYHLLTALHGSCQSLGVELRVFCSP